MQKIYYELTQHLGLLITREPFFLVIRACFVTTNHRRVVKFPWISSDMLNLYKHSLEAVHFLGVRCNMTIALYKYRRVMIEFRSLYVWSRQIAGTCIH